MKNKILIATTALIPLLLGAVAVAATDAPNASETKQENGQLDIGKISESFGHLIGKNLETLGLDFDIALVMKGIQDSFSGKPAPLSEAETVQLVSQVQESAFQKMATKNLDAAEEFLKKSSKEEGVVQLESGKLQYKVEKAGQGEVVKSSSNPKIRYTGKFLDGRVFGASKEEEVINLDETIAGFSKGIIGMQEGEKRTLFIHPELGYGTAGYLPPNSLLIFEIELVKANAPAEESHLADQSSDLPLDDAEVADAALDLGTEYSGNVSMRVVLFQPEIPGNTGNIVRTCKATRCSLTLIKPLGFDTTDKALRRAGLDYWLGVDVSETEEPLENLITPETYFFSSKGTRLYTEVSYSPTSTFVFGSETKGLPPHIFSKYPDRILRIPMDQEARCLNLSVSVAIVIYEAWRQQQFRC